MTTMLHDDTGNDSVEFEILGTPKPQGSKKAFSAGGRAMMKESGGLAFAAWRNAVADKAKSVAAEHGQFNGALCVRVEFRFEMPKSRTKRVREQGWAWKTTAPDVDKLARALFDGMKAGGLIADDALVVWVQAEKIETGGWTGATVSLATMRTDYR